MARKKKLALEAAERFAEAETLPHDGCQVFSNALSLMREYVDENLPYKTELKVTEGSYSWPFGLRLTYQMSYCLPCGVWLSDAEVRREIDLGKDPANLTAEEFHTIFTTAVDEFADLLRKIEKESNRNLYHNDKDAG